MDGLYRSPKVRFKDKGERPAFLKGYPVPEGRTFNVNSFLGPHDPHGGKFYVPQHAYNKFLSDYVEAYFEGYPLFLTENYHKGFYRYFIELDFEFSMDLDTVMDVTVRVLPMIQRIVSEFYQQEDPQFTTCIRTPYKVHLNFTSVITTELLANMCRDKVLEACRIEFGDSPPVDFERVIDFPHGSFRLPGSRKASIMVRDPEWVRCKVYYPARLVVLNDNQHHHRQHQQQQQHQHQAQRTHQQQDQQEGEQPQGQVASSSGEGPHSDATPAPSAPARPLMRGKWKPAGLTLNLLRRASIFPTQAQVDQFERSQLYLDVIYNDFGAYQVKLAERQRLRDERRVALGLPPVPPSKPNPNHKKGRWRSVMLTVTVNEDGEGVSCELSVTRRQRQADERRVKMLERSSSEAEDEAAAAGAGASGAEVATTGSEGEGAQPAAAGGALDAEAADAGAGAAVPSSASA